jgi:flagellar M-ring protein FliF
MQNGEKLTSNQASAIKNLIARAVRGMNFTNVSVFDAETMMEVAGENEESPYGNVTDITAITSMVESNIAGNVRRVLEKLYGEGTVAVSVKGTLNMERLIQESILYTTPEKINEEDKTGLLYQENVSSENSGSLAAGDGGVVGADANADTPRYTAGANGETATDTYANSNAAREWLYNSVKEQRQIDPGVLENATIGVVIDTDDKSIPDQDLIALIANSAGIDTEEARQKITVIRALSPATAAAREEAAKPDVPVSVPPTETKTIPLPIIIAIGAGVALLLLLLILLLLRSKKKKAQAEEMDFAVAEDTGQDEFPTEEGAGTGAKEAAISLEEDDELEKNEEIINLRMQHSLKLKQNIGDFVEQNPQIAAKLVQSWLRGEDTTNGGNHGDPRRKQK